MAAALRHAPRHNHHLQHTCQKRIGLPCLELSQPVHVCAGDTLEVLTYERLLPLKAEKTALGTLEGVRKGDCLVAFSRREVHTTKRALETWATLKCCVVYGALPAEARTQQVHFLESPPGMLVTCTARSLLSTGALKCWHILLCTLLSASLGHEHFEVLHGVWRFSCRRSQAAGLAN